MQSAITRTLVLTLIVQQLFWAAPAAAFVLPAGLPVDGPALSRHGGTSGSQVSAGTNTGDATYSVPILAPPGTGGLTPSVRLAYSSANNRQNGPVGVGWQIDIGPAVIERSTRNGAPKYDATDEFELAGMRLRKTGTPGRYVTENHSFLRVEHLTGGSDYWRVLRPDGTRLYYGFDPGLDPLEGSVLS